MRRIVAIASISVTLAKLALVGCGNDDDVSSSSLSDGVSGSSGVGEIGTGPVLTLAPSAPGGMAALLHAAVVIDDDCIFLESESDGTRSRMTVVWPSGTKWQADPPGVVLPDGTVAVAGDTIESGGGAVTDGDLSAVVGPELARQAQMCGSGSETWVVNSAEPISVSSGD